MITSLTNEKMKEYAKLNQSKYREEKGLFIVEGPHLVSEAKQLNLLEEVITTDPNIEGTLVSDAVMKKLSNTVHPVKVLGICKIVKRAKVCSKVLVLDCISDPTNLGTLLRSAIAFGFETVFLANGSVDPYNDKVIRGSQGAILKIPVAYTNMEDCVRKLQGNDVKVYASTLSKRSINLKDVKEVNRFALVVGNEGSGVSQLIQDISDYNVKIAHSDCIDSLNVGVATSFMLYYFDSIAK